jgi:4-hydroxy-3-polyprenylbenzoate decarboxylase
MKRLIVGISGASAAIYGIRLLEVLRETDVETHLVISSAAKKIILMETDFTVEEVEMMADHVYDIDDIGAAIASGSFKTDGMAVIPCSIKSLSAIANSYGANLLLRAADVTLKERRRLVAVVRETPLHRGHLQLMLRLTDMGAIIFPPLPAFYHRPRTVADIVDHTVGRVLDLFDVDHALFERWGGSTGLITGNKAADSRPEYNHNSSECDSVEV